MPNCSKKGSKEWPLAASIARSAKLRFTFFFGYNKATPDQERGLQYGINGPCPVLTGFVN